LDEIREAIRRAATASNSYRHIARLIGSSPQGLHNFLNGSEPRLGMRLRLTQWYLTEVAKADEAATVGHAVAALHILTRHLPETRRRIVTNTLLAEIEEAGQAAGVPPPVWLSDLRANEDGES
jgi:hypothetical protein